MERCFVVADSSTGIPFRAQEPMTRAECRAWIEHDVNECHKLGLFGITQADYEIIDTRSWRTI